jgi:hypothetical protein
MTDFTSLWDDAGAAAETEAAERRLATAKVASASLWPFLSRSADLDEFGARLNLVEEDLTKAASAGGVSVADLVTTYTRQFGLLAEARKATAASQCACGHASLHHADGGACPDCGCKQFRAARTAAKGPNQAGHCDYCEEPSSHLTPTKGNGWLCPDCEPELGDNSSQWDEHGERKDGRGHPDWRPYYTDHLASIKQALQEGQDPLEWLEGEGGVGQPEKVGGHSEGGEQTTPDANQPLASRKQADAWTPGSVSDECLGNGMGCHGSSCDCGCHQGGMDTNDEVLNYHKDDPNSYYKLMRATHHDGSRRPF